MGRKVCEKMSENGNTDSLTTYQKKVTPSLVSAFLDVLSPNKDKLTAMAQSMIDVDKGQEDLTFLLARGIGYAVQAYQAFDNKANQERIDNLSLKLDALRARDVSSEIMRDMGKTTDPLEHASIISSFPERQAHISTLISKLSTEKSDLSLGASIAFRDAWDCAVRFGEIRDISTAGTIAVKLDVGVYRASFKSHVYMFQFTSAEDWNVFEVNADKLTLITNYKSVEAVEFLAKEKTPRVTSATKARKICKVCYTGYRGYVNNETHEAIASAYNSSWEAYSAGNPTSVNFALVNDNPSEWYARSSKGTKLPKETTTPSK